MYFPYFRGRQYELLALRELVVSGRHSKSIIPVVEPIKLTSTLSSTLKAYSDTQTPIALVLNPSVGELTSNVDAIISLCRDNSICIPSILFDKKINNNVEKALNAFLSSTSSNDDILTILNNRDFIVTYEGFIKHRVPRYTLCPDERQIKRAIGQNNKILFEDKFKKQDKNAAYPEDEFFSEDHLYFLNEGYVGVGDYSIIGNEYFEGGFAPYAVAIHIVYLASDNTLRIRHFISDSNDDISDVAGKFHEAVTKLANWCHNYQSLQLTLALSTLLDYHAHGYYPGLPTIKKLSIMHHLELIGTYLDKGKV